MRRCRLTLEFGRDIGGLNAPSQKQQDVQLLKFLVKGKVFIVQLLQTLQLQIERFPKQRMNQGKRPFLVGECLIRRIFPVEEEEQLNQGLQIGRLNRQEMKGGKSLFSGERKKKGRRKALSDRKKGITVNRNSELSGCKLPVTYSS